MRLLLAAKLDVSDGLLEVKGAELVADGNTLMEGLINEALETYPLGVPPFELPGFGEGVEPEMGNICYPGPSLSNPLEQQPIPFPIPEITAPDYSDVPLEGPEVPNIFYSRWVKRDTAYGTIKVRELSDKEVRERGLHRPKSKAGYGATDKYFIDKAGNIWLGGDKGELDGPY